jgi:flagellar protein FliJ
VTRPAFNFRLERVRALRERFEDMAKEELAESLSIRLKGEAMLQAAQELHSEAQDARRAVGERDLTGDDLVAYQAYLERTERGREAAALELDRRDAEVDARRTALTAAARERQVLERLKERRRRDHSRAAERRDGALLDEIAIVRHRRAEGAL